MALIISSSAGLAVSVADRADIPIAVNVGGSGGIGLAAILIGLTIGERGNVSFRPTLDNVFYLYTLGDQIGTIRFSIAVFAGRCGGQVDGLSELEAYYAANRVAVRAQPMQVRIGTGIIRSGYLTDMTLAINSSAKIGEASLTMTTIPQTTGIRQRTQVVADPESPPIRPEQPKRKPGPPDGNIPLVQSPLASGVLPQ